MMGYNETLAKIGCELKDDLTTDVILQSLTVSYEPFIMNFYMNGTEKIVAEFKRRRKRWNVGCLPRAKARKRFSMSPRALSLSGPCPDEEYFHCHQKGHWFRNYKNYFEGQKKKKGSETSALGINVIEINIAVSYSDPWVFDTGSMIHTCKSLQGLSLTRIFTNGE
jgi:hypothetical protein